MSVVMTRVSHESSRLLLRGHEVDKAVVGGPTRHPDKRGSAASLSHASDPAGQAPRRERTQTVPRLAPQYEPAPGDLLNHMPDGTGVLRNPGATRQASTKDTDAGSSVLVNRPTVDVGRP